MEDEFFKWAAGSLLSTLGATLIWVGRGVFGRLKRVEETKADKELVESVKSDITDLKVLIKSENDKAGEGRRKMHDKMDKHIESQHAFNVEFSGLVRELKGRLNGKGS